MIYLKIGIVILLLIFVGTFVYQNYGELSQDVSIRIPPMRTALGPSPMILYFSIAILFGIILAGLPFMLIALRSSAIIKKQRRLIASLEEELSQLQLVNENISPNTDLESEEEEEPEDTEES